MRTRDASATAVLRIEVFRSLQDGHKSGASGSPESAPSATAVLPTPGSPMSTGLFLVRRDRIWMQRRISSSRPMTGSSLPSRAAAVRSRAYRCRASYLPSGSCADVCHARTRSPAL